MSSSIHFGSCNGQSVPMQTWSTPATSATYSIWSSILLMLTPGPGARKNGTVTIPITPPVPASARNSSSLLPRACGYTPRAAVWEATTGTSDTSQASSVVRRPTWPVSTMMPSSFMTLTLATPNVDSPASVRSVQPTPTVDMLL